MSFLTPELTKEMDLDLFSGFDRRETPFGEYLGAKVREGFDYTTTRMMVDEDKVARAERAEYGVSKSYFWGGGNPYDPITQYDQYRAHQAKRRNLPVMGKEEWEASKFYRPGMEYRDDMTGVRAEYMAKAFDQRRYRDSLIQRSPDGIRNVAGFVGQLIGNVPDPINFIPLGLAGKGGTMGARVGAAALEGAVSTAAADAIVLPDLADRGEAVGWQDAATDIFFGSLIGGLGGWGAHSLHQRRVTKLKDSLLARHREVHARAAEKAMADFAVGEPVDVSTVYRSSDDGLAAIREAQAVARAYDEVHANPMGGPADEILATIEPHDIERILIQRGPSIMNDAGEIVVRGAALKRATGSKSGFGLVKIIWKHGEKSSKPEHLRVTRADIVELPHIVRQFDPVDVEGPRTRWRIPREDGSALLVAAKKVDADNRLVTVHIEENPKGAPSVKREAPLEAGVPGSGSGPHPGYTRGSVVANGPRSSLDKSISSAEEPVNWSTGQGDDFKPVELPGTRESELEAMGMDKNGNSPELEALMGMIERDELDFDQMKAVERIFDEFESTQRLEEAGLEIINCVLEAAG